LVYGEFAARGGISVSAEAQYVEPVADNGQGTRKSSSLGAKSL
jgi:hypothetical protein